MAEALEPPRTGLVSAAGTLAVLTASLAFAPLVQGLGWWFQGVLFSVVAVGDSYAIQDGHHRVSVAKARGALTIDATIDTAA